jgi:hypothetical protein
MSPVQIRQNPAVNAATSATFLRPSPPSGNSTLRLVSQRPGASMLRLVSPRPGTSTTRIIHPSLSTTALRLVSPGPGIATLRLVQNRGTPLPRLIQHGHPISRQHPLNLTPVSTVTRRFTSTRSQMPGAAALRLTEPNSAARRLDLGSSVMLAPRPVIRSDSSRVLRYRMPSRGLSLTGPVSLRPRQAGPDHWPNVASFRPAQPGQHDGGLNEPGAYDNHDGAGCSFW